VNSTTGLGLLLSKRVDVEGFGERRGLEVTPAPVAREERTICAVIAQACVRRKV
jgi:hypothetical protein